MYEDSPTHHSETTIVQKRQGSYWTPVLALGLIAVSGFTIYQGSQVQDLRRELGAHRQDVDTLRTNMSGADTDLQKTLAELREQLASSEDKTTKTIARAQVAAKRHADAVASKIEQEQAQTQQAFSSELTKMKASNDEASEKISGINSQVDSVKTDVAAARSDIQKNFSDLQRVNGDLGVMSGLIATNSKEIQMLRELGDRNIYEFNISKSAGLQKVGDIQMKLNRADVKRNRYTAVVLADDKMIEKKDRTTNEPVQFYVVSKSRIPYEVVVNEVSKDTIKGYLATPKVGLARNN